MISKEKEDSPQKINKNNSNKSKLLLLHPEDNIFVLREALESGEQFEIEGKIFSNSEKIFLGHKIAIKDIALGSKIIKYGSSIGSATKEIKQGEHVHLHNVKSDYTSTYSLEEAKKKSQSVSQESN